MQFIQDTELLDALKKLGFDEEVLYVRPRPDPFGMPMITTQYGHTIEQVERWLLEKYPHEYFFFCNIKCETLCSGIRYWYRGGTTDTYNNPFSARLEGIRQAVKYLEQKGAHNEYL